MHPVGSYCMDKSRCAVNNTLKKETRIITKNATK